MVNNLEPLNFFQSQLFKKYTLLDDLVWLILVGLIV